MWGSVETIRDLIPDIPPLDLMLAVCGDGEVYNRLLAEGMGGGGVLWSCWFIQLGIATAVQYERCLSSPPDRSAV